MKQRSTSDQVIKSGHFPPQGSSHHCHKRMYKGTRYLSLGRSSSLPFYITTHSRQSCCEGVDSKSLSLYPVLELLTFFLHAYNIKFFCTDNYAMHSLAEHQGPAIAFTSGRFIDKFHWPSVDTVLSHD